MLGGYFITVLCIFTISITDAQQRAKQKCTQYSAIPNSFPQRLQIVGGTQSLIEEFPHMVGLGYGSRNSPQWLCGGTLISENFVLTAAHCTTNKELGNVKFARLGTIHINEDRSATLPVQQIFRHPGYKPPSQYHDIALVKLASNVRFSKSVLPACLNTVFDLKPRTNKLTATGWGRLDFAGSSSPVLLKVELDIYPHKQCRDKYKGVSKRRLPNGISDSMHLCAGGAKEPRDTCQGDSGGPLVMKTGNIYTVVGVTSFGKACGVSNTPGVYTRVSNYIGWIEKVVWS